MDKIIILGHEIEKIYKGYSYFRNKEYDIYLKNNVLFKVEEATIYILELSKNSIDEVEDLRQRGYLYNTFFIKELNEKMLYGGFYTNKLYLDNLINVTKNQGYEQLTLF